MRYNVDGMFFSDAKIYAKIVTVKAVQMTFGFTVTTEKGVDAGMDGDYLCIGTNGERWPMKKEEFEKTYREV